MYLGVFLKFHRYLGKISNLTNIFQVGWNQQLENVAGNCWRNFPKMINALFGLVILFMVHKSGDHQLSLAVYPILYDGFYTSKRWLFGISSIDSIEEFPL